MVTELGAVAEGQLDEMATIVPPGAAGPVRVSVPVEDDPPSTVTGASVSEATVGALIVRVAAWDDVPNVALLFALVCPATPFVDTVKVAKV